MYCSHCGTSMPENLNYCKNCGIRNPKNALIVGNASNRPFAIAAMFIGGGGLFAFIPLLRELLRSPFDQVVVLFILLGYLAAVFGMFSVLIGHIWKNSGEIRIKSNDLSDKFIRDTPPELRPITTAQLEEPRERPASVTENTTRTLDDAPFVRR